MACNVLKFPLNLSITVASLHTSTTGTSAPEPFKGRANQGSLSSSTESSSFSHRASPQFRRNRQPWTIEDQNSLLKTILDIAIEDVAQILNSHRHVIDMPLLSVLIRDLARMEALDKALGVFYWMQRSPHFTPNARTYHSLIAAMAKAGQLKVAERLLKTMIELDMEPSTATKQVLVLAYAQAGQLEEAIARLEQLSGLKHKAALYIDLAAMASKTWQKHLVRQLFADMCHVSGTGDGFRVEGLSKNEYGKLICALMKVGLKDEVGMVVEFLVAAGESDESLLDIVNWTTVICAFWKAGNLEEAERRFQKMQQRGIKPDLVSFQVMFAVYAQWGKAAEAAMLLKQMRVLKLNPTVDIYNAVIGLLCRDGSVTKAKDLLKEMQFLGVAPNEETFLYFKIDSDHK